MPAFGRFWGVPIGNYVEVRLNPTTTRRISAGRPRAWGENTMEEI
jgi:hypothetical protein